MRIEITNQESVKDARIKSGKDRKKSREPVSSETETREDLQAKFSSYLYNLIYICISKYIIFTVVTPK